MDDALFQGISQPLLVWIVLTWIAGVAEMLAFWRFLPAYYDRLLLPLKVDLDGLSLPDGADSRGVTQRAVWRYDAEREALYFRRQLTMGRRPYCAGCLRRTSDGLTLRWAPFPLWSWLAAGIAVAMVAGMNRELGLTAWVLPFFAVGVLISGVMSRRALTTKIWPELQIMLREQHEDVASVFD